MSELEEKLRECEIERERWKGAWRELQADVRQYFLGLDLIEAEHLEPFPAIARALDSDA